MRYSLATLALAAAAVASPMPQGVTSAIAPQSTAPAGCSPNYSGNFEIQLVNVSSSSTKRSIEKRDALVVTLKDGVLTDAKGRTGYIASNNQFQFDGPPQAGAIYTAGWSACSNGSLALGGEAIFWQCFSGSFANLYDDTQGAQCSEVYIEILGGAGTSSGVASQLSDGQPTATAVSQTTDGQIQAPTSAPAAVSQISDGQIQATTATAGAVSQISDGQIQATTAAPVSQISDGQIQATSAVTAAPVSQISDGQIQATTAASPTTAAPVSQISDGQIQAPTGANGTVAAPTQSVQPYTGTGAGAIVQTGSFGVFAGLLAIFVL